MAYKVLIVEDDDETAQIAAISLRKMGFSVDIVNQGDKAVPRMKEWKPEVVVLDLELPGQNGLQILQQMFLDAALRNLVIIANTVHMDAKDDLGFAYYAHFQRTKGEEPVMLNKLAQDEGKHLDLRYAIANMLGEKFGTIPQPLAEW